MWFLFHNSTWVNLWFIFRFFISILRMIFVLYFWLICLFIFYPFNYVISFDFHIFHFVSTKMFGWSLEILICVFFIYLFVWWINSSKLFGLSHWFCSCVLINSFPEFENSNNYRHSVTACLVYTNHCTTCEIHSFPFCFIIWFHIT